MQIDIRHERLKQPATFAFTSWPTLESCAIALYAHLGPDILMADQKPLACTTLCDAIRAFEQTYCGTHDMESAALAFLQTVVLVAETLCNHTVYVTHPDQRKHCWMPFQQSYPNWLSDNSGYLHVQIRPNSFVFDDELASARRRIATLTMSHADYARVFGIEPYPRSINSRT